MNTGIKINSIEIKTEDILYFSNIDFEPFLNTFRFRLKDNILDGVLVKFIELKEINSWTIITAPTKNDYILTKCLFNQWESREDNIKKFDQFQIDYYESPPIEFLHKLLTYSKNILINDNIWINFFSSFYKHFKISQYKNWTFIK